MKKTDCEFLTKFYYSNCVVEMIKAKIKNPRLKIYLCLPYVVENRIRSIHIMWQDENYSYDFSDENWEDDRSFWCYFWYKGVIRRWPKNFAETFSERRNRFAKRTWRRLYTKSRRN